ncbi:MAG TPA: L-aspartate oxidase [Streptosporangiaceae bacterium]|nr:L-aspartate oxidase [Streptosporangiaceae bacterium]
MIARRLLALPPGWVRRADIVIVGSGIAGVSAALSARAALPGRNILLVTKSMLDDGSTRWAQGGIAAALGPGDSPEQHLTDTLTAGAGLCDIDAVRALVTDGPDAVRRLIALGARFDAEPGGPLALTREGGHLRRRIAHAGGDATGAEVSRALLAALAEASAGPDGVGLDVIDHAMSLDLLLTPDGRTAGLTLHVIGEGQHDGVGAVYAPAVVLATGGIGQIYSATTNPQVSTGDGVALALRAGAEVADLEFVQFHPTVLWLGPDARGRQPLISEAVRGEGAFLIDAAGDRFMTGLHPLADLAPRDVVAKAIMNVMMTTGTDHVYLDGRQLGEATWEYRFPTIRASCLSHGIDPVTDPIPVVPAAHYASGGIKTDLRGRTTIPGLYACGETACTGVHGANRLASNSLLEGLVFAEHIAGDLARHFPHAADPALDTRKPGLVEPGAIDEIEQLMTDRAGVLRSGPGLASAAEDLRKIGERQSARPELPAWEATNLHLLASALVLSASVRTETRGSHWREDFPDPSDGWLGHLVVTLDPAGVDGRTPDGLRVRYIADAHPQRGVA